MSGSTALYARRGDPHAFQLVREHFNYLFDTVSETGGVVVKTIGDSVMAAYPTSQDALRGALASYTAMEEYNRSRSLSGGDRLDLKLGLYAEPSILVTLNERLDYFGQTGNIAARVAEGTQAGEINLSQDAYQEPGIQEMLGVYSPQAFATPLKGLSEPLTICRIAVPPRSSD